MAVTQYPAISPPFGIPRSNHQYPMKSGETFKEGAFVLSTAGTMEECGSDPAAIWGIALEPAALDPEGALIVQVAPLWEGQLVDISANAALVDTYVGEDYGIVKESNGIWRVDISDTTNVRVFCHGVDITRGRMICSVLAANRQIAP